MEPIEVTAHFDIDGNATPISISWRGRTLTVDSVGRRWIDEKGQHILVMFPGGRILETIFDKTQGRWFGLKKGNERMMV